MPTRSSLSAFVLFFMVFNVFLIVDARLPAAHADSRAYTHGNYVFGPVWYVRHPGKPHTRTTAFRGRETGSGFTLVVHNGDGHGHHRVAGATVRLNGRKVLGPEDFNRHVDWIKRPVEIAAWNQIAVRLEGAHGSFITLAIVRSEAPPTVSLSASPSTIDPGELVTLTWSSSGADTCTLSPGIGNVALDGSITVQPMETTTYTITATGTGGSATASTTVTVTAIHPPPTVTISANPTTIQLGQSTTLTWNSTDADIVSIDQGLGVVDLSGSLSVSPTQTTSYTITVTGPGGTATASAAVTVTLPPPTVTISANPTSIQAGESTTLTWNSTNSISASIDQGLGSVDVNGSGTLSPLQTTTYTITVTGPGGTASASVTVTVIFPAPTVTISADPTSIQAGQAATLTWSSTNATSARIEPEIGAVPVNGSGPVAPTQTTTYTITVTNPGGSATDSATVTISPISLQITSPVDGERLSAGDVLVQGILNNATGQETRVVVNGVVACLCGNEYVANHVPLNERENVLTVAAKDTGGNYAVASIVVNAETTSPAIEIAADLESGLSPLETTLHVSGSFDFAQSSLNWLGPGAVEVIGHTPETYQVRMTAEGVYSFTVTAPDAQGNVCSASVAIAVEARSQLDALLQSKWNGMKSRLLSQDIEGALSYFALASRDHYNEIFTLLRDRLPEMATGMGSIELVYAKENVAKYRIWKDTSIEGQVQRITYYIHFVKEGGFWYIDDF